MTIGSMIVVGVVVAVFVSMLVPSFSLVLVLDDVTVSGCSDGIYISTPSISLSFDGSATI